MTAQLLPNVIQKFFDSNGLPLSGGKLYSYQAGTTTPLATYTDETAVTPNANPVVLDSTGAASVWLSASAYKFVLKDSSDNVIRTVDNVSIINPASIDKTKIAANICGKALAQAGDGSIDVQVDNVTLEVKTTGGDNYLRAKDAGLTTAKIAPTSLVEVVFKGKFDCTGYGMHAVPQFPWSSPTLNSDPSSLPDPGVTSVAWSPNGEFLAITATSGSGAYIFIYQRVGDVLTLLAAPGTVPGTDAYGVAWSPDGTFLAVTSRLTPFITIYQRSGTTFTKLSNPATLPVAQCAGVAFSPNGEFLALAMTSSASTHIYKINGSTFTHITSPTVTCGTGAYVAWSPDSQFLGFCGSSTPFLNVYQRVDQTFTKLADPSTLPVAATTGIAWSPNGSFLALGQASSPFVIIYQQSGTSFTKVTDPLVLPPSGGLSVSWSPNGLYLAVASASSPYFTIYSVAGTTFTKIANPSVLCNGGGIWCDWSPDGQYLAMVESNSPYIQIYKTASTIPANALLWARSVLNV